MCKDEVLRLKLVGKRQKSAPKTSTKLLVFWLAITERPLGKLKDR